MLLTAPRETTYRSTGSKREGSRSVPQPTLVKRDWPGSRDDRSFSKQARCCMEKEKRDIGGIATVSHLGRLVFTKRPDPVL